MAEPALHYEIVDKDAHAIRDVLAVVEEAWREMQQEGTTAYANARSAGLPIGKLPKKLNQVLSIQSGAGVQSEHIEVAWVLGKMAVDFWRFVALPRIRDTWGDRALKEKKTKEKTRARSPKKKSKRAVAPKKAAPPPKAKTRSAAKKVRP